ncbi:MAG: tRNA (guanosine(37)-N1)-methyltransferase TrmD [Planctomycetota bacterium]
MRFDVLTLFPEIFSGYLTQSLLKLAIDRDLVSVHLHNLRDYSKGKHKEVDDRPFGGGPGMLIKPEPTIDCVEAVQAEASAGGPGRLLMMTPQGRRLDQRYAEDLAQSPRLLLLCGRYEGFDQRVCDLLRPEEVSIGDYVLNGGEVAAMTIIDTTARLIPGVLGDDQSNQEDTFSRAGRNLEHAQYTRPREYRGLSVPEVLLSGDHEAIAAWRDANAKQRTSERRADLEEEKD